MKFTGAVVSGSLRLAPSRKRDIVDLLRNSYDCITPNSPDCWKTSAAQLKNFPSDYVRLSLGPGTRYLDTRSDKMMDWASWEIARSALDESIKNSVGLLLYVDKIRELNNDELAKLIPSFDTKYISNFAPSALYICHFHSVIAGLATTGFLARDTRYVARVSEASPRWQLINASWQTDKSQTSKRKAQFETFRQYDGIRRNQASWLPERSSELMNLKKLREELTYRTERMGAFADDDRLDMVERIMPKHIAYQQILLNLLDELVRGYEWNRSYNPVARTEALKKRFYEYTQLAKYVVQ